MYAILRAVPNKVGGVVMLFRAILVLLVLPLIGGIGCQWSAVKQVVFWGLVANFLMLRWLGGMPAEAPYIFARQVCTVRYFGWFLRFYLMK